MKVLGLLATFFRKNASKFVRAGFINGLPGFISLEADGELQTTALEIEDGKITAIYVVRNLRSLGIYTKFNCESHLHPTSFRGGVAEPGIGALLGPAKWLTDPGSTLCYVRDDASG
jgi:hypothetical protein